MLTRRSLAGAGGLLLAGPGLCAARADAGTVEIRMLSDEDGSHVGFDPVGLLLQPGQTVRWRCVANYHTTTAYHPSNTDHALRIPRDAKPWASEVMMPGETFEVTLTMEGTYDYFCAPHEHAGMIGRLIVGKPGGPGSQPFDWFKGSAEGRNWQDVPPEVRAVFPSVEEIMARKSVPAKGF